MDFFVLCFFFIVLAFAFIGSLAFTAACPAEPVVWAEATDMPPTRAAQHTARIRLRILISRLYGKNAQQPATIGKVPLSEHSKTFATSVQDGGLLRLPWN